MDSKLVMAKKNNDIRQTGPQSYRDLQAQNNLGNTEVIDSPFVNLKPSNPYISSQDVIYEGGEYSPLQQDGEDYWGKSQYDNPIANEEEYQQTTLQDTRYENQPWYDVLANGIGKMLGKAGTTFVSSLVGLPYGAYQVAKGLVEDQDNPASNLWNNDVTQGLSDVDKWFEENMTNYKSQAQQQDPTFRFGDMNWWADNVITNAGFTLGAAASMAVGAGALGLMSKSLGFVNNVSNTTKAGAAFLSSLFSATGEGMIEAKQGVEERNKLEYQKLDDAFAPEKMALEQEYKLANQEYAATKNQSLVMGPDGRAVDPAYERYKQKMLNIQAREQDMQQRYNAGRQQIEESGQRMGNAILGLNQVLLTAGNLIQFGKGAVKSFDSARHAAEISSKATKPFGVSAVKNAAGTGYEVMGKNFGRAIIAPKNMIKEGSEEMNQQWIQSGAGAYYNEKDVNDYWKAKLDPEAYSQTTEGLHTLGSAISQGFRESWGDKDQYEQFLIGAMTGAMGSYMPTKIFNQDKTKSRWNPQRYGEWSGGAWQDISKYNRQVNQFQENIDELNSILASEDFPARVKNMVGHTYTESQKDAAAESDDKKAWKDADDKQMIHDIQAFLRAGKLDDLRTIYNEIGSQLSDDDVQNIIKSTTKEITAEEDKQNFNRQADGQIAAHNRKITELQQRAQDIADSQDMLEGAERVDYQNAVRPELEKIFGEVDAEYDAINQLEQKKEQYVPQRYFEGAYVDREGNVTASDDEIREIVKHNSEELNRKLDSYLESIDYVNRRTNGVLTKDQEDNLAYLHNLGKESNVRMQKIMADVRQQLPKKFLLKTSKTPEQLTKENASSDLVFSKDENTKDGYVEVDTSLMNDAAFADFFQREIMRGGNIMPEFGETADEKAAREEEEKNLPEAERKKKARERASKKWQNAIQQMQDDANEQWDTNWRMLVDNFMDNYKKGNNATLDETVEAFNQVRQNLQDASNLFDQAGEFQKTLMEYMANPSKVDEDRAKAEEEAQKAKDEQQAKSQFAGKDASKIKQGLADGSIDFDDFDDFAGADLSDVTDDDVLAAQQEVKKAKEGNQKAATLKQHIQEQLGDDPTQQELSAAQAAMQMIDAANLATNNPEDLDISMPELNQVPLDAVDPNASIEYVDALNMEVQQMLADAFNAFEEDKNAQDDIPDTAPAGALDDVEAPETGKDATTKTKPEVVVPSVQSPSAAANDPLPKNPLPEGALATIIEETNKVYDKPNTNGTWRSTTTRHPYGKSTGTYHETLTDKNSIQYKRSKAIWDYLNSVGAFDRQENSSADRIKSNDTVHFMVKYMGEITGSRLEEVSDENRPYSLVIYMLNDNGEVIGDLPLAELEPSFRGNNPTQQVKDLMSLQKKVFDAFLENYKKTGVETAIVDDTLLLPDADNLHLTFDNSKKPLLSKVKQVMKGVVPYRFGEINTLNEVANGQPFELGVAVTGTTIAKKRGDKSQHKEIVKPSVGTTGQPYLLLPTPSGEQIAVPFYMKPFDANQHRNTEMYKLLTNAIYNILTNNTSKDVFKKNMDVIEGLLQVKVVDGVKNAIDVRKDSVTMHLQSLTDANNKMDITVPFNQNTSELAMAIVNQLSGIPINVSLQFLNDTIEAGGRKANYNNVIGEIADVNLPKATNHTVNGWFTVELAPSAGIKPSKKIIPITTGVISETISGKNIEINTDTLVAYDPTTGEVITDNEEVNLRLAQIKAAKPQYQGKDRIQVSINGELRTYDTKENKFVKNAPIKKETTATPQPVAEETPDVSAVIPSSSGAVSFAEPQTPIQPQTQSKTLEKIENEMKQKKIVGRQTKDAWAAIPDDLKLKLVNEGATLRISWFTSNRDQTRFNNFNVEISLSDREGLIQGLTQANMAAKAGNMKVSEVPKYRKVDDREQKRANIQREKRWLQKNLPMFNSEERLKLIQGLIEIPGAEGWAWGRFQSGVITLSDIAAAGTTYHEAFHAVTQTLLDDEELDALYEAAKERYKESDAALLEELLAEDFRRYVQREETPIMGFIRKIFRRIMHAMKNLDSYRDPINLLFYKINNGEFKDTLPRDTRNGNAFYNKVRTDRMLDKSHPMHKAIEKAFNTKNWNGDFNTINRKWKQFKSAWQAEGYTPVMRNVYNKDGKGKVVFLGVRTNADEALLLKDSRQPEVREQYAAQQAREGRIEALAWDRLTPEQQMNLMNDGMTKETYTKMALEEKDQWVKCRA